jgi:excisionase family DNA binding protein
MENKVLTVEQVAKELGLSRNLIYKQARTGKMPGWIRVGDIWMISRLNLERFINGESGIKPC